MNITFIGGGNMASALIGGLLDKRFCLPEAVRAVEVLPEARARLERDYRIRCYAETRAAWADRAGDIVVFAVKPQQMERAARDSGLAADANLVISIAAGIPLGALSRWLGGHTRLVRAMPNTPALIGRGVTGLYPFGTQVGERDRSDAAQILGAVGTTVWLEHEAQLDAVTAVSGSGPAYVFYFIEALEQAAADLGLPAEVGRQLALQTFTGAAQLAAAGADPVAVLRARVTSKGGTTEAALKCMAEDRVKEAIVRAVRAAAERSHELGDELGKAG